MPAPKWNIELEREQARDFEANAKAARAVTGEDRRNIFDFLASACRHKILLLEDLAAITARLERHKIHEEKGSEELSTTKPQ